MTNTSTHRRPLGGASATTTTTTTLLLFFLVAAAATSASAERKVGGRSEVKDVLSNDEVQELGRFTVEYYNRRLRRGPPLAFHGVISAERQVVSGIKYYLHISAWEGRAGPRRTFYAVVLVKPWIQSKDLLSFAPLAE